MDVFDWIVKELKPEPLTTAALLYDHMDSQSDEALPIIYQPFDPANPGHWADRASALDFVLSTESAGKRVLDFGPGDGWPSLIIAPFVDEVVGVEGSHRRVDVCSENASRLGIDNAAFVYNEPGTRLPFDDESFDAIVAASSVEQTPDPVATLSEFFRVLRPGGRVRLFYEALGRYRGQEERGAWLLAIDDETTRLMLSDRHTDDEYVDQIGITYALPERALAGRLGDTETDPAIQDITTARLTLLQDAVVDVGICRTQHPSCGTLLRWLPEIGFSQAMPTYPGAWVTWRLFGHLPAAGRPATQEEIDAYLRPIVAAAVTLPAPTDIDPMITAVK